MKKKICALLLAAALALCATPSSVLAANETSGSFAVTMQVPMSSGTPSAPVDTDDSPAYSYVVNIPASLAITNNGNSFQITATDMSIPAGKELVVRLNGDATFEQDGNFYLYMDGNKESEHFIQAWVSRQVVEGGMETLRASGVLASFKNGELSPYDTYEVFIAYNYEQSQNAAEGTYSNTVYYTIGLE